MGRKYPNFLFLVALVVSGAVAAAPKDIVLVLDNSGSMRENDPQFFARGAVASFINALDEESRAALIIFDQTVRLEVPLTTVDPASKRRLIRGLNGINYRGQLTDSPAAVERAIYELKTQARENAAQYLVFMTDGIVDTGSRAVDIEKTKWLREELAADAAEGGIKVFAIAFTENADFLLIQSLAQRTDGEYFRALNSNDLGEIFANLNAQLDAATLAQIQTQGELSAAPSPPVSPAAPPAPDLPQTQDVTPPPVEEPAVELPPLVQQPQVEAPPSGQEPAPPPDVEPLAPAVELQAREPPVASPVEPSVTDPRSAELIAGLSAEDREALEEIAADTGIPLEQLVLELVGPDGDQEAAAAPPGRAIVTRPDQAGSAPEAGFLLMAAAAALLLLLTGFVVWFVMRRREVPAATSTSTPTRSTSTSAIPNAFLTDVDGSSAEATIQLSDKPVMIGRIAGSDSEYLDYLIIDQATVGRRHAIIKYKDYSFWVVDQGSINGTFINGERISGERQLKHADRIKFHKFEFEFSQPDMVDASRTMFAESNLAEATVAADAATIAATSAMAARHERDADIPAAPDVADDEAADGDTFFATDGDSVADDFRDADSFDDTEMTEAAAAASEGVFDVTGDTEMPGLASVPQSNADDETLDETTTGVFSTPLAQSSDALDESTIKFESVAESIDDDPDTIVNADAPIDLAQGEHTAAVSDGEDGFFDDDPDTVVNPAPMSPADVSGNDDSGMSDAEFDAEASAFFDDVKSDDGEGADKLSEADDPALPITRDDPNDVTLDEFIETETLKAPKTEMPGSNSTDVTLDAFISTSMFDGEAKLKPGDENAAPDPAEPNDNDANIGDTMVIDRGTTDTPGDDEDQDGSEDPTEKR